MSFTPGRAPRQDCSPDHHLVTTSQGTLNQAIELFPLSTLQKLAMNAFCLSYSVLADLLHGNRKLIKLCVLAQKDIKTS